MDTFDFQLRTRMVFGRNSIDLLGALAEETGVRRTLVVTDPGIVAAGHVDRGLKSLRQAGIGTDVFDGVQENPTTHNVREALEAANKFKPELLIGLGGGSSMDCAKGCNFLYTNGGEMKDYWGVGKASREMLPMIAVPTTAGTGSEMQSFALISDPDTHVKMACGDKKASCRVAILDPMLTLTQPENVTALTAVDALTHALETYVTKKRNPISRFFSLHAWRLLAGNIRAVIENPKCEVRRGKVQLGAAYAGVAIENSMLGAAHALANPLTAIFGTPHGQAVGAMMPHVIRANAAMMESDYCELLVEIQDQDDAPSVESGANGLSDFVSGLVAASGLKTELKEIGVATNRIPGMAEGASKQWTLGFNPVSIDVAGLEALYRSAV